MKRLLWLLLAILVCLTGCEVQDSDAARESEEPELTQEEIVNYMALTYVNGASEEANYPVEYEILLPNRTFLCETPVSNPAERLVYEYFYAAGTGDYELLVNRTAGSDFKRALQGYVSMDADGLYYEKVILHHMEIVPIEQFFDFSYAFCEEVATMAGSYGLSEYTVVKADASFWYNQAYREMNPEFSTDQMVRYFLVGRTDGDYFLLELYGEDYVG